MTALDAQGRRLPPATKPYRPSNGSEGMEFMAHWCDRCQREARYRETEDGADGCPIATAAFVYDLGDPAYPPRRAWADGGRADSAEGGAVKALDLFCGAGGATKGLQRAGFHVTGIDVTPQPHYCGDAFIQADALDPPVRLSDFDFVWASPPCQAYCGMQRINTRAPKRDHPRLIEPVRAMLQAAGVPYVIENVEGAPLIEPMKLCGSMFGLRVRRHRLFETSFFALQPCCRHAANAEPIAVYGDHPRQPGDKTERVNRARTLGEGQDAMGIDWMPWRPLTQAIPPAYSEFIGRAAMAQMRVAAA